MAGPRFFASALSDRRSGKFGTTPVFLATISTILGAILFLRLPYAVGHLGVWGALAIIGIGHLVTIPTALAVAEVATNRRVEGGGVYYIISQSFGTTIGGTIGTWLYMSQAISIAFYMIAFAEAFQPLWPLVQSWSGIVPDLRLISVPATLVLVGVIIRKGASLGVNLLVVVCATLFASLLLFFVGDSALADGSQLGGTIANSDSFVRVFAIVFPAFTGMAAGVGLSGDLKNPGRSIPLGTVTATFVGMIVYGGVVLKLGASADADTLADTGRLVMQDIAVWPPIIPIGLAAASLSSAIGSILVAPRTLQALGRDNVFPWKAVNNWISKSAKGSVEPVRATWVSGAIAVVFLFAGDIDSVSQVITMFFLITYGTLCSVSFLEHFSGHPSYRPVFRSRWYLSLIGAVMAFMLMFQIQPLSALLSLALMLGLYRYLSVSREGGRDVAQMLRGVMFQLTRRLRISIQKSRAGTQKQKEDMRPAFVALSTDADQGIAAFDLLRWICHRQGFGQYIRYIKGDLTMERTAFARLSIDQMIKTAEESDADIFVDTVVAPDYHSALDQSIQRPGISGLANNSVLIDFAIHHEDHEEQLETIVNAAAHTFSLQLHTCILRSSGRRFGYRSSIHVWLTSDDIESGDTLRLMVLLTYIVLGHRDWAKAELKIFASFAPDRKDRETEILRRWIREGRLPISLGKISHVPYSDPEALEREVGRSSGSADLVVLGVTDAEIGGGLAAKLERYPALGEVLFVHAGDPVAIS